MTYKVPTNEGHKHNVSVELTVVNCGPCGGTYAINERHRLQCWQNGSGWHCPYCRSGWGYYNDNENSKLKRMNKQLLKDKEDAMRRAAEHREKQQRTARAYGKLRARVMNGVCPCCNRSFENLRRHMQSEHADLAEGGRLNAMRAALGLTQADAADEMQIIPAYVSRYENSKHVPEWARAAIVEWMEQ